MLQGRGLKGRGGWLALFALWLQLALGYGHMHADEVFGPLGHAVEIGHGATQLSADHRSRTDSGDPAEADLSDGCSICAAAALLAGSVLPVAASLPLPTETASAGLPIRRAFLLATTPYVLFRTRAPPLRPIA